MGSAIPSSDVRYDLWLLRVDDEAGALDALIAALGSEERARVALRSAPVTLVHGVSAVTAEALRAQLSPCGVTLHVKPARRYALVDSELAPHETDGAPSSVAVTGVPVHAPLLGVAKVSYHAALVAAPAYVLQPSVLLSVVVLTLLTMVSWFGSLTGSVIVAMSAPVAVMVLRFSIFALIVRRSRTGQTDLRLGNDARDPSVLVFASLRIMFVSLAAYAPFLGLSWSTVPQLARYALPFEGGMSTVEFVASLLLLLLTFLLPLVALPGSYAAAALGTGCSSVHPFVGLVIARRIPGPYGLTLAYLAACWFGSVALMLGGVLAVLPNAASVANGDLDVSGVLVPLVLATGLMTLLDVTSTLVSARVLGLLTYHYREELGL